MDHKARILLLFLFWVFTETQAQIVINEGCNKNYKTVTDEEGDTPDWIELYNAGSAPVNLSNFSLSDNDAYPEMWEFPPKIIQPGAYELIFCSGKDRFEGPPFQFSLSQQDFIPTVGWNTHTLSSPFNWDGVSNLVINVCSYNNTQYTQNSVFRQTNTSYVSTLASFIDGSPAACTSLNGTAYSRRPNLRINGIIIDNGTEQNGNTDYPAPYGNWYWGARHQILIRASELQAAGLSAGLIQNIAFDVVSTIGEFYNYVDFSLTSTYEEELNGSFLPELGFQTHTNFKLDGQGESVYLFDDSQNLISSLSVNSPQADISVGHFPDASNQISWMAASSEATNNSSEIFTDTLQRPVISVETGIYQTVLKAGMTNPNNSTYTKLVYTVDGSDPLFNSTEYTDSILVFQNTVLRAKVFPLEATQQVLPSENTVKTYLFNISHSTPILLVTTDASNLYGPEGIFDNNYLDWVRPAHATYLNEGLGHPFLFESKAGMRMDGGAGGSRGHPQRSFRLSFAHGALGEDPIEYPLIPDRPERTKYSDIYLRNGSNQWLQLPYKDASQVRLMSEGTGNYYSSYRPVSVYINGSYFGVYELREKFNSEYFTEHDGADKDSIELLSLSYFYNLVLRALEGDVDNFWDSYEEFLALSPTDTAYFDQADSHFDLTHYTDYIIGESWMGNVDWPGNNIKIYRSDKTNYRWRFALIDLELAMNPNGWTTCTDNHIRYMLDQNTDIPYINIWLKSIQNVRYRNYFINRFADLINTSYRTETLLSKENEFFNGLVLEMPKEYARWGDPGNIAGQMQQFNANHLAFRTELACRNEQVLEDLENEFNLEKQISLDLAVFPDSSGKINLNSITPSEYPWTGIYFDGVPVKMEAIAEPGYEFIHWESNEFITDTLNPVFEGNITTTNTLFKAIFRLIPPPPDGPTITFNLYPNPTSDGTINLVHDNKTMADGCWYEVYDLNGRILMDGWVNNTVLETPIDLTGIRSSNYFLKIMRENELITTIRFMKQ
jgi:hypothetical protein